MILALLAALCAPPGDSLEDRWLGVWRRIEDRTGRPDPDGPLLQWAGDPQYLEYPFDQTISGFPIASEDAWRQTDRGARFYVQSLDEFTLTNVVQLKTAWPVGDRWTVGVHYHQLEDRQTQSHLPRLVVRGERLGGTPLFVEGHLFPRWQKLDADLEALVGVHDAGLGEVRVRVMALDPFVDAAYSLAQSRGAELATVEDQRGAPFALAIEALSVRLAGLRFEAYGGVVLDARVDVRTEDTEFTHAREGALGGALLEWSGGRVTAGASLLTVQTTDRWTGGVRRTVEEGMTAARIHGLIDVPGGLQVETAIGWSRRTIDDSADPPKDFVVDRQLWSLRLLWTPGDIVGADVGVLRADRQTSSGAPEFLVGSAAHRLVTRCTLRFAPHLWLAIGTGWDLDPADGVYDGSGMTLILLD